MFEFKSYHKVNKSSERNFGIVFTILFLIIGFYPFLYHQKPNLWSVYIALFFLSISIFFPKLFIMPNKLWMKFGHILGLIISPLVMGLIFFSTVSITGIIMRALGKDILGLKKTNFDDSYWVKRKEEYSSMKNQF